jgi:hypothetical protein
MFKCLKFIDDMMKQLNEADEMPMEDNAEMGGDEAAMEDPAAEGDMGMEEGGDMGGEAPAAPAAPTEEDIASVEQARTLIKALSLANPKEQIPLEFQSITPENAQQVIQFVKTKLSINNDEFGTELNNI